LSGAEVAIESRNGMLTQARTRKMSWAWMVVYRCPMWASYSGPRKANGAIRAPVLMPVTTSNSGRVPLRVQPTMNPAP
jgi:hypothetical protein